MSSDIQLFICIFIVISLYLWVMFKHVINPIKNLWHEYKQAQGHGAGGGRFIR